MSNAGKSLIAAGLCRIFARAGYKVCPFKSQNMALNSFITKEGFEMGRAQVVQAEAAGIEPDVRMNPILLKPTSEMGSQVIVNGRVIGNMKAKDYFEYKVKLIPDIMKSYDYLDKNYDIIVIEGAGSPAEINLKENDIVNMGLAKMVDAPVLLVGDIDRGGVFAQLYGTVALLEEEERKRIRGLIINKFRGDRTILEPGITMLEDRCKMPVVGVVPYEMFDIDDEDSLSERLERSGGKGIIDIAIIRLPRISNFTDFNVFESIKGVSVRYVSKVSELGQPDMIVIPGSKNTISDLLWIRENGLEAAVKKAADKDCVIFGICGGYQMLGRSISDTYCSEEGGSVRGMEFLDIDTTFQKEKKTVQTEGVFGDIGGIFKVLSGSFYKGYEIHMGMDNVSSDIYWKAGSNIYGSYIHGLFDNGDIAYKMVKALADKKGVSININEANNTFYNYQNYKDRQYDKLANVMRENMDMESIYNIL